MAKVEFSVKVTGTQAILEKTVINETVRRFIVRKSLDLTGAYVVTLVQMKTPVGATGQTRARITKRTTIGAKRSSVVIGGKNMLPNGMNLTELLEEGTGIYGPKGTPIVPKTAKVLRWPAGGMTLTGKVRPGGYAFAKSIKGMKPRRMFARTMSEDGSRILSVFNTAFNAGVAAAKAVQMGA